NVGDYINREIYTTGEGEVSTEVRYNNNTQWHTIYQSIGVKPIDNNDLYNNNYYNGNKKEEEEELLDYFPTTQQEIEKEENENENEDDDEDDDEDEEIEETKSE